MRIRTQLILAAFVLAVVPLAAIVTYSYHSSRRALESAYRREAERVTQQMDRRLAGIRTDLNQRIQFVSALEPNPSGDVGNIVQVMGEAASFVDALEFKPVPQPSPEAETEEDVEEADEALEDPEAAEVAEAAPAPPAPPSEPMVIELPPTPNFPRYVVSEVQKELIEEIGRLGGQLGARNLTPDEKRDIREELRAAQEELRKVVMEDRQRYDAQMREHHTAMEAHRQVRAGQQRARVQPTPAVAPTPNVAPVRVTIPVPKIASNVKVREATQKDLEKAAVKAKKTALIFGHKFEAPVRQEGEVVGKLTAQISAEQVIRRVLGAPTEDRSEVPFALDTEGTLYTRTSDERAQLDKLGILDRVRKGTGTTNVGGWIVSTSADPQSGLKFGVARPVGDNLDELRNTAGRNFGLGLGLIVFAMLGIVPLSNHLTRDVKLVTDGAERIAHGDLMTRLPVKTKNELGQLARAFNRMAEDLSINQQKLLEQERARKEQELQQRLMAVEFERKTGELEDARRFQLSMLPKEVPRLARYDLAVFTRTATEVGGDYYDFRVLDGTLSVTIGDATGHGAKAGTMVTVIKTLFAGYIGSIAPADFLRDADEKIKRMDLGRMAMALALARFDDAKLTLSSAGMPPVLVHRAASDDVEEIALSAPPLGTLSIDYPQCEVALSSGDTVLFLSDGFPELMNDAGQQLGYGAALDAFREAARKANADNVIAALEDAARQWHGDAPPNDDVTFVVVRIV